MNLVSISSKADSDQITQQIKDQGHEGSAFWTSGTKLGDNITWLWMGNGRPVSFTNWAPGQPDNLNHYTESCINIFSNDMVWGPNTAQKWNDIRCSRELNIICEESLIEYEYCST
ncbi:perlucin-like [Contarinia nasturtii]|uniref:perlucin-like n=1 Tax=Contarinia nasturtii TaxID=265458 RepID=UPI0012D39A49|nr:perlucin-like [Contarinia nasturtii]